MQNETLIIRRNDFTGRIEDGYTVDTAAYRTFRKGGAPLRPLSQFGAAGVAQYLTANPDVRIEVLNV